MYSSLIELATTHRTKEIKELTVASSQAWRFARTYVHNFINFLFFLCGTRSVDREGKTVMPPKSKKEI